MSNNAMSQDLINNFKRNGFITINSILSKEELIILRNECETMLQMKPYAKMNNFSDFDYVYRMPVMEAKDRLVLENIIGISPEVDRIMEKFFKNEQLKNVLNNTIGNNYKLWSCGIRLALANSKQLGFHNDSKGETGISILLEDQFDPNGVTCVLPKSHLWPLSSQQTMISALPIKMFNKIYKPLVGKMGDTFIFFKKTLHGRMAGDSGKTGLIMLIALYSVGHTFRPFNEDKEVLYKLSEKQDELHRLISHNDLEKINSAGVCKVLGEGEGNNFIDNLYKIKPSLLSPWHITKLFKVLVIIFQKIKSLIK